MMDRQEEQAYRRSRLARDAAEVARDAQEAAHHARIERLENRVFRTMRVLGWLTATLWLVGLVVILGWRYLP